eukprot:TRINITY_DN102926_c0_g1_i1.p1 TRINITY_DN102926_c0_g1~~TRINITY_DN102926_c0_g1_i1.p1  ORF type:complete len:269 (+),score=74.12 TRINITY_DN102926_c0_g1_i1:197-1003(+)
MYGHKATFSNLSEAVATNNIKLVQKILSDNPGTVNHPGPDGTTPLCSAAMWGNDKMVALLLEAKGVNPNAQNRRTNWTALHAATFQEHGKIVHMLLMAGCYPTVKDHKGRTPVDYASISPSIWPFFQAQDCVKTSKTDLIRKGLVRKSTSVEPSEQVQSISRPGSAYIRVSHNPLRPPTSDSTGGRPSVSRTGRPLPTYGSSKSIGSNGGGSGMPGGVRSGLPPRAPGPVDILAGDDSDDDTPTTTTPSSSGRPPLRRLNGSFRGMNI